MDVTNQIQSLVKRMQTSSEDYDTHALAIWNLLSDDQRVSLQTVIKTRPPIYDGHIMKDPDRIQLKEYGLVGKRMWNGEDGYTVVTFAGLAAYNAGKPPASNITLPGETKKPILVSNVSEAG